MKLAEAEIGSEWKVIRIASDSAGSELQNRLYALGIYPGVTLRLLRMAPMGDPLQVRVGGTLLSIRRQEAEAIEIDTSAAADRISDPSDLSENGAVCPS